MENFANSNSLAVRFTENKYATKQEVSKELKTGLVDNFWRQILEYRKGYSQGLNLETIDHKQLYLCMCVTVSNNLSKKEMALVSHNAKYIKIADDKERNIYQIESLLKILGHIAKEQGVNIDNDLLKGLITGRNQSINLEQNKVLNYLYALQYAIENYKNGPLDVDFLAELYSRVSANSEMTTLYRETDFKNPSSRVLVDKVYSSAPAYLIDDFMNQLFNFLSHSDLSPLAKASVVYYYINYIKPFESHNEDMAVLIVKSVMAKMQDNESIFYIDLESFLADELISIERLFQEIQKYQDVTYFLNFLLTEISEKIEDNNNLMSIAEAKVLTDEYNADAIKEAHQGNLFEEEVEIIKEPQVQVEEKVVEVKPQEEIRINKEEYQPKEDNNYSGLAISSLPVELDEKQAERLMQDLLESEPEMKKGPAYFYSKHCTMGKIYTIQQYKKELSCAYETARTSMELLTKLGYYKEAWVKNKKVYTPIKRK